MANEIVRQIHQPADGTTLDNPQANNHTNHTVQQLRQPQHIQLQELQQNDNLQLQFQQVAPLHQTQLHRFEPEEDNTRAQHRLHLEELLQQKEQAKNTEQDQEDLFFSLDMVTDDMDFEQAYSTYNLLQQKNAINAVEHLKKVQILNQQYDSTFDSDHLNYNNDNTSSNASSSNHVNIHGQHDHGLNSALSSTSNFPSGFGMDIHTFWQSQLQQPIQPSSNHHQNAFNFHRSQILHGGIQQPIQNSQHLNLKQNEDVEEDDFDHFFSNTESDALEKFLDNLANPNPNPNANANANPSTFISNYSQNSNPQADYYTHRPLEHHHNHHNRKSIKSSSIDNFSGAFDLHTMKPIVTPTPAVKEDLSDAFSHPPSMSKIGNLVDNINQQRLPTSPNKRSFLNELDSSDGSSINTGDLMMNKKKKKRSTTKQLLTVEQKRLNHSFSEQKRRQLCKLAYERCLGLIFNLDEYINLHKDAKSTSKKKQKIKDGLPNISKYSALVRISNEITTIKDKNSELKRLLSMN